MLEEIDIIFFKLKDQQTYFNSDSFTVIFLKLDIPIKKEKIEVILDFLFKEGYVDKKEIPGFLFEYRINIKGLLFNGFINKQKIDTISNLNENIQTLILTCGTAAAGVYGIFEISKWLFHHEHWRIFF